MIKSTHELALIISEEQVNRQMGGGCEPPDVLLMKNGAYKENEGMGQECGRLGKRDHLYL